jgi:hypothetical protein
MAMARIRYRDDGLGDVLEDGDVLRVPCTMRDAQKVDEAVRQELFDERMRDAHMHRPGFRTSANVRSGISRADAMPAIEAAYKARWQDDVTAWRGRSPADLLGEARRVAEEDPYREGRANPHSERSKAWRRRQSVAEPFGGTRAPGDASGGDDELDSDEGFSEVVCPHCGGVYGRWSRNPDDDDAVDNVIEQTQNSGVERVRRLGVPDRQPTLDAYSRYDSEIANAWRTGK